MYTIKVNVKKNISNAGEILDTLYFEASNISTKIHSRSEKKTGTDLVKEIVAENNLEEFYSHNPNEESWNILHISYFNEKGDYKNMLIFGIAHVYIMQNGKTIDTIYV